MGLSSVYTVSPGKIPDLFEKIRDGQAPEQLTQQLLKDWGFSSSNDRALIPILKALNFLSPDGKPTSIYHDYRNHSRSKEVLGSALKNTYSDLFLIKENPTESDKSSIKGKFKSFHNVSDHVANLMTRTFFTLLKISDISSKVTKEKPIKKPETDSKITVIPKDEKSSSISALVPSGLYYNIQIHLPATKDVEVYNAIFKSLREHLIEE